MEKRSKSSLSEGQSNFVQSMLDSSSKKFTPAPPNTGTHEDPTQIERVTRELQQKWVRKK